MARTPPPAYTTIIGTRAPKPFCDAVRTVADNRLTTVSSLLRAILADLLRSEGFDPELLRDADEKTQASSLGAKTTEHVAARQRRRLVQVDQLTAAEAIT